jgi:hypothetical protein
MPMSTQIATFATRVATEFNTLRGQTTRTIDIGSTAGTARPTGYATVYWYCDFGVTPTNAVPGDLIFNRPA